jgi:hypothetical protein
VAHADHSFRRRVGRPALSPIARLAPVDFVPCLLGRGARRGGGVLYAGAGELSGPVGDGRREGVLLPGCFGRGVGRCNLLPGIAVVRGRLKPSGAGQYRALFTESQVDLRGTGLGRGAAAQIRQTLVTATADVRGLVTPTCRTWVSRLRPGSGPRCRPGCWSPGRRSSWRPCTTPG